MITMTVAEIAAVVGGTAHGDPEREVTAPAAVDSRSVEPGGLFVAIVGERVDGHDYAAAALDAGAAAVLGSRTVDGPCVVVDDATAALGLLARHVLDRLGVTVVAITGSQGKTSVKDLATHLLGARGAEVVATRGNNNNELGVPLTVLRATAATRVLVVEMGARGIGHIALLCRIAPPHVAVALNVGSAHLGEFGSVDNIAQAKGEIVEQLRPGGTAVLNLDDHRVRAMAERRPDDASVRWFGRGDDADVRILDVRVDDAGEPDVDLEVDGRPFHLHVPLVGAHHAANVAAAVAIERAVEPDAPIPGLDGYASPSPMRMQRFHRADGLVVIDDSYNANPESMLAALRAVAGMTAGRRVAVLGEMLELGSEAHAEHVRVGREAAALGLDRVVVVGEGARGIAEGAGAVAVAVADVTAALADLASWLRSDDLVVVKASRGSRLERVTDGLLGR